MTTAIEVAIGLILLYLTLSLVVSAIQEGIAAAFGLRGRALAKGIKNLLGKKLKGKFYDHGLIKGLSKPKLVLNGHKRPSYISGSTFSSVALDLVASIPPREGTQADAAQAERAKALTFKADLKTKVDSLGSDRREDDVVRSLKQVLQLFQIGAGDVADVRARLEAWYDESMERVSGWYKRRTKLILFAIGLVLCAALNADTFNVARVLWTDDAVRAAAVASAEETAQAETVSQLKPKEAAEAVTKLAELQIPLGWVGDKPEESVAGTTEGRDPREVPEGCDLSEPGTCRDWAVKILGILITAMALTFGAQFWFDLLKKFVNLRSSGDPEPANGTGTRGDGTVKTGVAVPG